MNYEESYRDKTFRVNDPDARLRRADDLQSFATYADGESRPAGAKDTFKRVPTGTEVTVQEVSVASSGSESARIFARVAGTDGTDYGWTSTRNLEGRFVNETLGVVRPEPGAGRFGPNAAWAGGNYLGQIDLVRIVNTNLMVRHLALKTVESYFAMVAAAARHGVRVTLNSGFRSYPEQKHFHDGWTKRLPGFNPAARPGNSNHQNGVAFDIDVAGGNGNPTYDWLRQNGTGFGFFRTVSREPWHWEHDKDRAVQLASAGTYKTSNVVA